MTPKEPLLVLRNVAKNYEEGGQQNIVYRNLNARFEVSERVALLGRSGCGKTTLLNLVSGIDLPDAGSIMIKGIDVTALDETERTLFRRENIGFIFQFFNLIPTLTVLENLLLPLELTEKNTPRGKEYALALLDEVGLAHRVNSFPETMSGGEQQRVAIVRALVHDPVLILADEPTGNLDSETSEHILSLLDAMLNKTRASLLMVTHSLETASITDRVLTVHDGQLSAVAE
ncbi:MAG TPA: ABC transporter ATP-binding protein [Gammaproteobacteria bacterium]|nr:ABC transporter ATP-binding protein [Gammaproteobacteria bacterium]